MRVLLKALKGIVMGAAPIAIGSNAAPALESAAHHIEALLHMLGVA